jgi:hypothetical protein
MAEKNTPTRIWLREVIIAYAQGIFTARAAKPGDPEKYGAAFLLEKNHPSLKQLSDAVIAAAKVKWPTKWEDMLKQLKAGDRLPVHNGDAKANSAGYAGRLYVNAGNSIRPTVLDRDKSPLTASDGRPYSGAVVNAFVEIWAQDNQHGKRVNASLLGVQFVRDGERLAGGSVATADDFEALPDSGEESGEQSNPEKLFE